MIDLLDAPDPLAQHVAPALQRPHQMNISERASGLPPSARPRVLLVEGDMAMRTMLIELLAASYQVETANDGLAPWRAAQENVPDLVLIGLYPCGLDSLALIRSLRANAATAALPIVILTASVDRELMLRCLEAGASNFLLKPFGMTDLLNCLKLELKLHAPYSVWGK